MSDLYYKKYIKYRSKYINLKNQLGGTQCNYVNTLNKDDCREKTKYNEISKKLTEIINDALCLSNKSIAQKTLDYCNKLNASVTTTSNSLPTQLQQRIIDKTGYIEPPLAASPVYETFLDPKR